MIKIKLLKDYKELKRGAVLEVSNNEAFGLIDSNMAVKYNPNDAVKPTFNKMVTNKHTQKNMLSVIIPSYKDIDYLQKTIDSLLENAIEEIEVIPVLDGFTPDKPLKEDLRVRPISQKNMGMRGAINTGVKNAKGEYIMRTDAHCVFGKGFDYILIKDLKENEIVTPRRYFLDPVKWEVMDLPPVEFEKLVIQGGRKFAGQRWSSRDEQFKNIMIAETMGMQGSCWLMGKSWWEKVIVELQTEGYGPLIQDSHEMIFKTWKAGGKMMLNKNTWFAHKERHFPRAHNNGTVENPANCDEGYKYALDIWKNYYENEIKPLWKI